MEAIRIGGRQVAGFGLGPPISALVAGTTTPPATTKPDFQLLVTKVQVDIRQLSQMMSDANPGGGDPTISSLQNALATLSADFAQVGQSVTSLLGTINSLDNQLGQALNNPDCTAAVAAALAAAPKPDCSAAIAAALANASGPNCAAQVAVVQGLLDKANKQITTLQTQLAKAPIKGTLPPTTTGGEQKGMSAGAAGAIGFVAGVAAGGIGGFAAGRNR